MALSKPVMNLFASYLQNLYLYPIRTKSITSCILSASANCSSQLIAGEKNINCDSVLAFGIFGLLFGGTLPHFFYQFLEKFFPAHGSRFGVMRQLFIERIMYTPLYQMFSLYMTSRLEGKDHDKALKTMLNLIKPVLFANWKVLTIIQVFNFAFVPPVLRVLFVNLLGFFWVMYVAKMKRDEARREKPDKKTE